MILSVHQGTDLEEVVVVLTCLQRANLEIWSHDGQTIATKIDDQIEIHRFGQFVDIDTKIKLVLRIAKAHTVYKFCFRHSKILLHLSHKDTFESVKEQFREQYNSTIQQPVA